VNVSKVMPFAPAYVGVTVTLGTVTRTVTLAPEFGSMKPYNQPMCKKADRVDAYALARGEIAKLTFYEGGAGGYVIKDIRGVDLVAAVRTVGSGRSLLDNRAAAALMSQFRANVDGRAASAGLTEHEHLLLDLIGKGLTNRQIGQRMMEQPSIVTHDVNQLFAKLGTRRPVIGGRK